MSDDTELEPQKNDERAPYGWGREELDAALASLDPGCDDVLNTAVACLKGCGQRRQLGLRIGTARSIASKWAWSTGRDIDFNQIWDRAKPRGRGATTLFELAIKQGWAAPAEICCIDNMRIMNSDPTIFLVTIKGSVKEIAMSAEELMSRMKFSTSVMNAIFQVVKLPSRNHLNRLAESAERIEVDEESTEIGQFRMRLIKFLDEFVQGERSALALEKKAWYDDTAGRSWFSIYDFQDWLRYHRIYEYGRTDAERAAIMFHFVRLLGGGSSVINLGKSNDGTRDYGTRRRWWVPIDPRSGKSETVVDDGLERRRYWAKKKAGEA